MGKYRKVDPYPPEERAEVRRFRAESQPPYERQCSGLQTLYRRYCYELHIIERHPTSAKRVSIFMREDMAKLDRLDAQTRFLAANGIESGEQLAAKQAEITKRMEALTTERQELYSEIRRISRAGQDPAEQKSRRDEISTQLKELRKDLRLCDGTAERSARTREELDWFLNEQERDERKMTGTMKNERNYER